MDEDITIVEYLDTALAMIKWMTSGNFVVFGTSILLIRTLGQEFVFANYGFAGAIMFSAFAMIIYGFMLWYTFNSKLYYALKKAKPSTAADIIDARNRSNERFVLYPLLLILYPARLFFVGLTGAGVLQNDQSRSIEEIVIFRSRVLLRGTLLTVMSAVAFSFGVAAFVAGSLSR